MMAKKVLTLIKLQIPGGQANPAPPVGPALGQHGVNIMEFCKAFNAQTAQAGGRITRSRSPSTRTARSPSSPRRRPRPCSSRRPEHPQGLRRAEPEKVGRLTRDQVRQIAETKLEDLNARDLDQAMASSRAPRARWEWRRRHEPAQQALPPGPGADDREHAYAPFEAVKLLKDAPTRSSTRPSRSTSTSGSTSATPTSSSAARSCFRTARGATCASPSSPRERRRRRRRTPAPTSSARPISPRVEGGFDDFDVASRRPT